MESYSRGTSSWIEDLGHDPDMMFVFTDRLALPGLKGNEQSG